MNAPAVRPLGGVDVEAAFALCRSCGVGYRWGTAVELEKWLSVPDRRGWGIGCGGELGAAAFAQLLDGVEAASLAATWEGEASTLPVAGDGCLTVAATAASMRRRGWHSTLVAERVDWLRSMGAARVFSTVWLSPGDRSTGPLAAAGFVEVGRIDRYWDGCEDAASLMALELPSGERSAQLAASRP